MQKLKEIWWTIVEKHALQMEDWQTNRQMDKPYFIGPLSAKLDIQ